MLGDAGEDLSQVRLWVEPIELGSADEAVERCGLTYGLESSLPPIPESIAGQACRTSPPSHTKAQLAEIATQTRRQKDRDLAAGPSWTVIRTRATKVIGERLGVRTALDSNERISTGHLSWLGPRTR